MENEDSLISKITGIFAGKSEFELKVSLGTDSCMTLKDTESASARLSRVRTNPKGLEASKAPVKSINLGDQHALPSSAKEDQIL